MVDSIFQSPNKEIRILNPGISLAEGTRVFRCNRCGCVWQAGAGVFTTYDKQEPYGLMHVFQSTCPNCSQVIEDYELVK